MKNIVNKLKNAICDVINNTLHSVSTGFTLLELLVVVLIIGILASIALPQYRMAVTKAKVASILPLMRRWKDALMEYNLQHGNYFKDISVGTYPSADDLGINWPSDWECWDSGNNECGNDYWNECFANEEGNGMVYCIHNSPEGDPIFRIFMFQPDEEGYEGVADMIICEGIGVEGNKVCKTLGGQLLENVSVWDGTSYKL